MVTMYSRIEDDCYSVMVVILILIESNNPKIICVLKMRLKFKLFKRLQFVTVRY